MKIKFLPKFLAFYLSTFLAEGGAAALDEVMGEGVGQVIFNGILEGSNFLTNPIGSLIDGIASLF